MLITLFKSIDLTEDSWINAPLIIPAIYKNLSSLWRKYELI